MRAARIRAGWMTAVLVAFLCASGAVAPGGTAAPRGAAAQGGAAAPNRGDLEMLRRRVALLECELALSKTRKPYLIVDAEAKRLRYRLLGMTMREVPVQAVDIAGLLRSGAGGDPGARARAGTIVLKEKEGDPRLTPLTPADVEAGAADENVADALPPEAPAVYSLLFKQPMIVRVEGLPESQGAVTRAAAWWRRLWPGGARGSRADLRVALRLEEGAAREVYRSLVPGQRIVLVPPPGYFLPDSGQEAPDKIKPGKTVKLPPTPRPGPPAEGVPFQIPPPVEAMPEDEARPADGEEPRDEGSPAVDPEPDPDWEEVPTEEARPTPSPGEDDPEETPTPEAPPDGGA